MNRSPMAIKHQKPNNLELVLKENEKACLTCYSNYS